MNAAGGDDLLAWFARAGRDGACRAACSRAGRNRAALARAKEAAEAANEAKTRFLASVSHRNPPRTLNAIYGYAQLLERGSGRDGVQAGKVITAAARNTCRISSKACSTSRRSKAVR